MQVNEFIQLREGDWQQLDTFIRRQRGRAPLTAREVHELGQLYRAVTSDLAVARRDYPGQPVVTFLNGLVTRAHSTIYQADVNDFGAFARYFTQTIPRAFRAMLPFTLAAFLLFMLPALIAFRLLSVSPEQAPAFGLDGQRVILEQSETWTDIPEGSRPFVSTFIMANNIRIAILAFGGGIAFGLFTVYILVFNGLVIGGVLGLAAHYGMAGALLDFIIGHGVVELSIIFIAGGSGLALGWALLNPGAHTRRDALSKMARAVVPLVVLAIPALIVAGLIEGFISPTDAPTMLKVIVGVGAGALLYTYLLRGGSR